MLPAMDRLTLKTITDHLSNHGVTPTQTEIGSALGIRASSAWNRLNRLEEAGVITRKPNVWRNIRLV